VCASLTHENRRRPEGGRRREGGGGGEEEEGEEREEGFHGGRGKVEWKMFGEGKT